VSAGDRDETDCGLTGMTTAGGSLLRLAHQKQCILEVIVCRLL
jgi:hypothetical protein